MPFRSHYPVGYMGKVFKGVAHAYRAHAGYKRKGSMSLPSNYNPKRIKKSNIKPRTVNTMQRNHRAVRKTTGRKKVRSIVHRKRGVKVGAKFRKKVKKVLAGTLHNGTMYSTRQGTIGIVTRNDPTTNEFRVQDQGGYSGSIVTTKIPDESSSNARVWFSQPLSANDGFIAGDDLQFFTPMKILDAASVLWNQKTGARDYTLQTRNLNTRHNLTTGSLVVGTKTDMDITGLKIVVHNAYVKMTLKNSSQRALLIEVYKCVPTAKNPLDLPLGTFIDAVGKELDSTNSGIVSAVGVGSMTAQSVLVNYPGCEPNHFAAFRSEWKYEKVKIKIAPGEVTSLFFQGPKDYTLDFDKLNKGDVPVQHLASKQTTMAVMMSVLPDLVFSTAGTSGVDGQSGRFVQNIALQNLVGDPISVEWTEVYSLRMPDIVGFQNGPASDAGNMYTLNKRVPRRAYNNFVFQHAGDTNATYDAFDEENPGDLIAGSRFN